MALRFIDGFETYGPVSTGFHDIAEAMSGRWDGMQWNNGSVSDITIQAGMGTGLSLYLDGADNYLSKSLDQQQTWIIGFWIKFDSFYSSVRSFLRVYDGEDIQCEVKVDGASKKLEVWTNDLYRGESTAIVVDEWYFVEVKFVIDATAAGTYELKIDGVTEVSGSAITSETGNDYANSFCIMNQWNDFYLDDLYVCDGTAGLNDFLGPCKVNAFYPTSDSTPSAWTTSAGTDHFALVNDSTRDTTDYLYTGTNTNEDMYNFTVSGGSLVLGVQLGVEGASEGTAAKGITAIIRDGGNESTVSQVIMGGPATPRGVLAVAEYLPGTSTGWTNSTINSTDFGFEKVS